MYDTAKKYVDTSLRKDWDKFYKVYKLKRVKRTYEGISDRVVPEARTIIETLVSNIAGGDVEFHFQKTNEEQTADTNVLNSMLDYYMACNKMPLKNQEWVRDMLLYGTGVMHVTWRNGKPFIENIPLRDFFVDPTSTGMVNTMNPARYAGFVYLGDKETMQRMQVYDAATDSMVPKYKNIDKLPDTSADGDTDKKFKDDFAGSTLGDVADERQLFVICLYDLESGKLVEVANRREIIFQDDIPYQREESTKQVPLFTEDDQGNPVNEMVTKRLDKIEAFLPFPVVRDYIDSSLFYGEGEMSLILDSQERLNDYESMDDDNLVYQNTPMYTIDPQFADLAPEIETIPGAVYPIPKGALNPMPIAEIAGNMDAKKDRIQQQMRSATAADEAVQGVQIQQARVTATEVNSQLNQAQNRFSTKISNLENEGYSHLASIIYKMIQIFVTTKTAVRIVGKTGVSFKDYDPWEYNGEYEPHVKLDSTKKAEQMEVGQKLNQMFEYIKNNPVFDPVESGRFILQHLDPELTDEAYNELLNKNPGLTPEQLDQAKQQLGPKETELIQFNYKDGTPFTKSQIEQKFGLQPDPMHEMEEKQLAVQMGAQQADLHNPYTQADGKPDPGVVPPQPEPPTPPEGMSPSPAAKG